MQEKPHIKNNILQYIEYKGISKYRFYVDSGITRGVLEQNSGLSEENIAKFIAYAPEINIDWLITGEGNMLKGNLYDIAEPSIQYKRNDKTAEEQDIPLFNIDGVDRLDMLAEKDIAGYIKIPNLPKSDGAVYVRGDSMYPILNTGDIVIYKQINPESIIFGEMYLVSLNRNDDPYLSVKFIHKSDKGSDHLKLVSYNTNHNPQDIKLTDIQSLGIVKASIRLNTMF